MKSILFFFMACSHPTPQFYWGEEVTFHTDVLGECKGKIADKNTDRNHTEYTIFGVCSSNPNTQTFYDNIPAKELRK